MHKYFLAFSAIALLCVGAFGQSSGLPDANAVHVVGGKADKAFNLNDGSTPASQAYVVSALSGAVGGGGTTAVTTNQVVATKTTTASSFNKICTPTGSATGTVACGGTTGDPISVNVVMKQSTPVLNTVGVTGAVGTYGLTTNATSERDILVPTTVSTNYTATVFKREMWFKDGTNLAGVDNFENDIYMFDQPEQMEYMFGWQCNRHNTGFWQYDNFKNGWHNTAVPCSIVSGHTYHWILWMHRDPANGTACTLPSSGGAAPCMHWDTFQLDDLTAATSNTYTLNATYPAESVTYLAAHGSNLSTWTGVGSQVQLDVVDSSASAGSPQAVSMIIDNDSLTTYIPVTASQSSSQTVTETTGNLGEYDFDTATPTSGLTVTGSPTADNTNSYSPANGVLFNADTEYYTAPISTTTSTVFGRTMLNVATQTANSTQFIGLYNGTSQLFNIFFNAANGFITANNTAGTGISTTCSTTALSTSAWHLLEFAWTKGTGTAGGFRVLIDGTQTCSITGVSTGANLPTSIRFGELGAPASPWVFSMDNVGFSSTGLLGAVTVSNVTAAPLYDLNGAAAQVQSSSLQATSNLSDIANLGQAQINLGLLASAFYPTVGTDTNIPTSGQLVGAAGTIVCIDAAGGLDTVSCPTNGVTAITTTGTSGAASLIGTTLNIPQYSAGGGASTPVTSLILKGNGSANGVVAAVPGTDFNVPLAGIFRYADYASSGSHTPYDMARQDADAYAVANPATGSVLILPAGIIFTCDAVALPVSASGWGTTSIIGQGVNVTTIKKQTGCTAGAATFSHPDATGPLSRGYYFGFTVDANHIDTAACNTYGYQLTTFNQVSCGNAALGGDHEWEFGNTDASNVGWMDNIYGYQLQTFDTVGDGKGAILTPVWSGTALSSLTVTSGGTKVYSQYVHASLIGPGVALCSTVPTLTPTIGSGTPVTYPNIGSVNYGAVNGATVTTAGNCSSAAQAAGIYVLVQGGNLPTYGFKMTNTADSHFFDMEPTGSNTYALYWNSHSGNNQIIGEHPYTNATVSVYDAGPGNRHTNPEIDGAGQYGFQIQSTTGTIQNPVFLWDSTTSYIGATAFYFSNSGPSYVDYDVNNSQCSSVTPNFVLAAYAGSSIPAGAHINGGSLCDGTSASFDKYAFEVSQSREGQAKFTRQIVSTSETQSRDINVAAGVDQPYTETLINGFTPTSLATEQASPARKFMTNCYNGSSGTTQVIMQLVPQTGVGGQALFNIIGSGNCNVPLYIPSSIFTNGNGVYLGAANNFNVGVVSANGDLNFRANGTNSFAISSVDGNPYSQGSWYGDFASAHLLAVAAPTLANLGTTGSTSYTYAITAVTVDGGETLIGTTAATASGNATLNGTNLNTIKAPFVRGAFSYNVYRHANGASLGNGLIGNLTYGQQASNTVLQDTGQTATNAEPAADTTGALAIRNGNGGTLTFFTKIRQPAQLSATQDIQLGTTASGWLTPDNGEAVSFSATPAFSPTTTYSYLQLTGAVTGFTMASGPYNGFSKIVDVCQDATGGRSFPTTAAPSNVKGFNVAVNTTAQTCSSYTFVYSLPQTQWDVTAIVTAASAPGAGSMVYPGAGIPVSTGSAWGTSITPGTGIATFLATPSSANLAAAVTGETGSGALVFGTSPTLVTPALGTPASGVLTNATGLPLSTGVTGNLPVANLGSGTSASSSTFWRGDGSWATPSGSNPLTTLGDLFVGGTSGAASRLAGPTSGTVPYTLISTPSGGVAGTPAWGLAGIGGRSVTTTSDTIAATDRGAAVTYNSASAVASTLTSAATLGNNFDYVSNNSNAGTVTFTPGAGTINGASTWPLGEGDNCAVSSSDNTNFVARCSPGQLTAGANISITPSAYGKTLAVTGVDASGAATTAQTNAEAAFTGDVTKSANAFATTVTKINGTSLAGLATGILKNTTTTGVPSIAAAGTDYQAPITLTTTGTSGAATLISNTLNIPQYAGGGSMVYPTGSGIPIVAGGTSWGTTITPATGLTAWFATPSSANLISLLTDETGTGSAVFANTPTLVTPNIGAATGTSLLVTGNVDGTAPVTVTTGTSATLGGTFKSGYTFNQEATAATAVAYTLPTAAAGRQYCVGNSWNGTAATTGVLTVNTSASGQFIIDVTGVLSATGGNFTSAGAAGDAACFVGVDATHWQIYTQRGTWTRH